MKAKTRWALGIAACAISFAQASVAPFGTFEDGLLAQTRPTGWLAATCRAQTEGLTGHPEALSYPYDSCLWAGEISREGGHGDGWWRYEQTGYYMDGLLRLGYALGDAELIAKGERGVDWTLAHASPEGYLGNRCLWDGAHFNLGKGYEMWPMAVFFRVMKAKYDATGDARIPAALARYYLLYGPEKVAEGRNTINVEGLMWAYGRTGDARLLELAEKAWNAKTSKDDWSGDLTPQNCADDEPVYMHGVSYSEELKIPLLLYAQTGKRDYLEQALNAERKLVRDHLLPDGCPSSTEQTRGNCVHWGHETCVVSDWTWTLGYFLETTGHAADADRIEACVFNAGLGSIGKDFKSLQYFSNLNQFIATSDSNHNPYFYGTTWCQYRPTHETECCAGNMHRFLPNYVSRLWLKDADGAPVAALYGPCEVDFGWCRIREETCYPFDGKIVFRFSMDAPRESAFTYRVPGWCTAGASVMVNGTHVAAGAPGTFATIRRTFRDGDALELDFPMETVFEEVPRCRYVIKDAVSKWVGPIDGPSGSQGTVVRRGPLLFAYPIAEDRTEDTAEHANMRGKKSRNPAFKCWNIRPAGPFNFALAERTAEVVVSPSAENDGFAASVPPVSVNVKARRIAWELERGKMTPRNPEAPRAVSDEVETLSLVPYGSTMLRLAVFPDLSRRE
ncbi:MAG: glycoside hydrolase family 127 protein [Kiritimatiellae bacterium]|nr:glycoside hydrolase family 127 protein [Kiritimatiellia bacterium]